MPVDSDGEEHDEDEKASGLLWVCDGPIEYVGGDVDKDIANLRSALEGVDVVDFFIPCVAPASVYWFRNEYYATEEEFVYALADALRVEYRRIHEAGIMVHVDDAVLWHMFGTIRLRGGTPEDYRKWAQLRVEALNHALEGIPADRVRYHICSGSDHAPHTQDPLLRDVIDMVLQVNARYLLIEQGNARHEHEWRIWEDVTLPDDKVLVPGVVTHQTLMVEHPELVAQRLVRLAGLVGRERVMAGTDCGFAQTASTKRVPLFTQWAKLQAMVEGAQIATKELWPAPVAAERRRSSTAPDDAHDRRTAGPDPASPHLDAIGLRLDPLSAPHRHARARRPVRRLPVRLHDLLRRDDPRVVLELGAAPAGAQELLHRGGDGEQRALAARGADELQPYRQAALREARGDRHGGERRR